MKNFKLQALSLADGGYPIVPIATGTKAPLIKEWQKRSFDASDIRAGVGVKCGQGVNPICAIDIDVTDADMAGALSEWCADNIGMTAERVGSAPKTLLVYRAPAAGWRKVKSTIYAGADGADQAIEILGDGQQFVAYHIHPGTGREYEWVDFLGGIEATPAAELPFVSEKQIAELLAYFDSMMVNAGLQVKSVSKARNASVAPATADSDDFMAGMTVGVDLAESRDLLTNIHDYDYDSFIAMGMALHAEYFGSDDAYDVWLEWASRSDNFKDASFLENHWRNFKENTGGVTLRTLLKRGYEAKSAAVKAIKIADVARFKDAISNSNDSFALEAALKDVGKDLDTNDVVMLGEVKAAAKAKYKNLVGTAITNRDLDRLLNAGRAPSTTLDAKNSYTEFGNATRMLEKYGKDIMFAADTETWYRWRDNYWQISSQTEIEQLAKRTIDDWVRDTTIEAGDDAGHNFIQASQSVRMMSAMVKIVRTEPQTMVVTEMLDVNKKLFTCKNGSIDLSTGELLAPDRTELSTISSLVDYDAEAKCPVFTKTVSEVFFDDAELVAFFKRLMGYTMLGAPDEDMIVIPYGNGSNGKSTVLGAIKDAMGMHAVMAASEMFTASGGFTSAGGPRDDILRLRGRRFVYTSEPDEDRELKEGLIKSMTGGEAMSARSAYSRKFVEFVPTWTVIMPTNHKPVIKGDDFGIWRRILLLPFTRNFSNDPDIVKDNTRGDKLALELSGILNWLVEGALEYQKVGLNPPASIQAARDSYKEDMDLLAEWIDDCCVVDTDAVASNHSLWASWQAFAEARGELRFISNARTLNKKLAGRANVKAVKDIKGCRGRGMQGIGLKAQEFGGFEDLTV